MIFRQIDEIISGQKTQTRRVCKPGEYYLSVADRPRGTLYGVVFYTVEKYGYIPGDFYSAAEKRTWDAERIKWKVGQTYAVQPGHGKPGVLWRKTDQGYARWCTNLPEQYPELWQPLRIRITSIRQERLQDISKDDVVAEGVGAYTFAAGILSENPPDPRWKFIELWDTINTRAGDRWANNPDVWVISFELVK